MANKVKKSNKKQPIPFRKETNVLSLKPWSDLPELLINVILWKYSTLMFDMSYGGVTKSWRSAQTKQCSNPGAITQPWLELHDVNKDIEFKFNISFHQGEWTWLEILCWMLQRCTCGQRSIIIIINCILFTFCYNWAMLPRSSSVGSKGSVSTRGYIFITKRS